MTIYTILGILEIINMKIMDIKKIIYLAIGKDMPINLMEDNWEMPIEFISKTKMIICMTKLTKMMRGDSLTINMDILNLLKMEVMYLHFP